MRSFATKLNNALYESVALWRVSDDIKLLIEAKVADGHIPTVAVDLDGTLTSGAKFKGANIIDPPRDGAKEAMEQFREWGFRVIVFTVRGNVDVVAEWLGEHEIPYDFINENPDQPPDSSGKVIADVYVDDRAIDGTLEWSKLAKMVKKRLQVKDAA